VKPIAGDFRHQQRPAPQSSDQQSRGPVDPTAAVEHPSTRRPATRVEQYLHEGFIVNFKETGQLADKSTRGQSSRGQVNSRASQLAETFDIIIIVIVIMYDGKF